MKGETERGWVYLLERQRGREREKGRERDEVRVNRSFDWRLASCKKQHQVKEASNQV
jgi:hypothetical protein